MTNNKLVQLGIETSTRSQGYLTLICPKCSTLKSHRKIDWSLNGYNQLVCVECNNHKGQELI